MVHDVHVDRAERVRVLIVDDDPRVRAALRAFLSASPDIDVVGEAGSAAAAVETARTLVGEHGQRAGDHGQCTGEPRIVAVVDVLLPDIRDGLNVLRTLSGELRIPVVAMSFRGGLRGRALAAGAYRFVNKDSPPDLLVAALRAGEPAEERPGTSPSPSRLR